MPCPTNHRNVQRMGASIAQSLRLDGSFVLSEKGVCVDCGVTVYRQTTLSIGGRWNGRKPEDIGERTYACVALRQKSA